MIDVFPYIRKLQNVVKCKNWIYVSPDMIFKRPKKIIANFKKHKVEIRPKKAVDEPSGHSFSRAYFGLLCHWWPLTSPIYFRTNLEKNY